MMDFFSSTLCIAKVPRRLVDGSKVFLFLVFVHGTRHDQGYGRNGLGLKQSQIQIDALVVAFAQAAISLISRVPHGAIQGGGLVEVDGIYNASRAIKGNGRAIQVQNDAVASKIPLQGHLYRGGWQGNASIACAIHRLGLWEHHHPCLQFDQLE